MANLKDLGSFKTKIKFFTHALMIFSCIYETFKNLLSKSNYLLRNEKNYFRSITNNGDAFIAQLTS